jgi:ABC-type Fe3+/spermidine/putrescine transport system ATPase subunit
MDLSLTRISKVFGSATVLKGIDLQVREGEFVSLLGPSGCGKTTTLNIIAGFLSPDAGDVHIGGQRVNDVPVHQRDLGMVFQGHALFPHLTCFDNVAFGLRMRRLDTDAVNKRVHEALDLVHLTGFEDRYPRELSGGQQQRVGLARALAVQPRILLLDEPLSNLDAKLRRAMQTELRSIHNRVRTTMVYVTHDQEEALTLSDRVAVMNAGVIEQLDAPQAIYQRPRTRFVADFIGSSSFLEGTVTQARPGAVRVAIPGAGEIAVDTDVAPAVRSRVQLGVRSDRVRVAVSNGAPTEGQLTGTVVDRAFAGAHVHVSVDIGDGRQVTAHLPESPDPAIAPGARVRLQVSAADWMLLQ